MKKNSRSKLNKGKTLGVVAATLATISLAGVGYASWNIADNGKKEDTGDVTVEVGDVVDGRTVSVESFGPTTENSVTDTLKFDSKPRNDEPGKTYLFSNVDKNNEDLSVTMDLKVKALDTSLKNNTVYYGVRINGYDESKGFGLAIKNNWIVKPSNLGISTTSYPTNTSGTLTGTADANGFITGTIKITITFTWGALFNSKNPIEWVVDSGKNNVEGQSKVSDTEIINAVKEMKTTLTSLMLDVKVSNEPFTAITK